MKNNLNDEIYEKSVSKIFEIISIYLKYNEEQQRNFRYLLENKDEYDLLVFRDVAYKNNLLMFKGNLDGNKVYIKFTSLSSKKFVSNKNKNYHIYAMINGINIIIPVSSKDYFYVTKYAENLGNMINSDNVIVTGIKEIILNDDNDDIIYN